MKQKWACSKVPKNVSCWFKLAAISVLFSYFHIFLFSPSWLNATPSLSQDNKAGGEVKLLQYVFEFCFIFVLKVCSTLCTLFATLYIGVTLFSCLVQSVSVLCYSTMCSSFAIFCVVEGICNTVCSFCFIVVKIYTIYYILYTIYYIL